ncbi:MULTISPECIES: 3-ketoacyl-ACP reductase [unclassified Paenibacillus]|uniref:3-ketoacyl-ACP reductase n=1 Tax=unclassified Paenibacillus TaxID=185978 RepID=UPI0009547585|nr:MULTISPECIES: 3-ketoacyl-ACP reductase [unclassified Paenibacillus]ASS66081.1 3-ketoacyl-ACP reductase [Paenibacillus sp. RUD330]SIQ13161.1 3-oxoacyl-[acyl-carrier protein] reductase [Paenibacillus sp. RU4X]SIQ34929.1 3-oxoacyl-[acyl-carrier protein] reductase [Paenibacillus sp. RU4T]
MELKNKTALITGAGKGIGRAAAIALAKEGVHLGLISRTESELASLARELTSQYGISVHYAVADISDAAEAADAAKGLAKELGSVDVLINNAGVATFGTVAEMDPAEWERIVRINLFGTYYVTHAVLPSMLERKSGAILNIASTAGERGFATGSAYNASKFAVMGFTEALMQEVRKSNIRVTALTPSTVNTPLSVSGGLVSPDKDNSGMMQPEDVAELIVAALKLPDRVFIKTAGIWTTNP